MLHRRLTSLEDWRDLDPPRHRLVLASCPQVTCVGSQKSLWSHLLPLCPSPAVPPRAGLCWPPALAPSLQTGWRAAAHSQGCWEKRPGPGTGSASQGVPLLREPSPICLSFSISVAGWAPQEAASEMMASRDGRKQVRAEEEFQAMQSTGSLGPGAGRALGAPVLTLPRTGTGRESGQ